MITLVTLIATCSYSSTADRDLPLAVNSHVRPEFMASCILVGCWVRELGLSFESQGITLKMNTGGSHTKRTTMDQ
ncbi:hypothetical protein F5141DRAFT_1112571, partial [Pisolithus sp. B1]